VSAISTQVLSEFFVFSKDFNAGQVTEGARFVNPFAEGFQLEDWVTG